MTRGATGPNVQVYFLWVCLRTLMEKTGEKPPWKLVAEAMGGDTQSHNQYVRYNNMTKNPPIPDFNKTVPELEELIARAKEDGFMSKTAKGGTASASRGGKTGRGSGNKGTTKPKRKANIVEDTESDEEVKTKAKRVKAGTIARSTQGSISAIKPEEIEEEEYGAALGDLDAEGETDAEHELEHEV